MSDEKPEIPRSEAVAAQKLYGPGADPLSSAPPVLDRTRKPSMPGFRVDEQYVEQDRAIEHVQVPKPASSMSGVPIEGTRHSNTAGQIEDLTQKLEQIRQGKQIPLIALEDDVYRQKDQNFAAISFIPKELYTNLQQDRTNLGKAQDLIKIRGIFRTREAAEKHIKRLMSIDPHFDVHLVECHRWTTIGSASLEETEYLDETVSEIMKGYFSREHDLSTSLEERVEQARADGKAGKELTRPGKEFFDMVQAELAEGGEVEEDQVIPDLPDGAEEIVELDMKRTAEMAAAAVLGDE